MTDRALRLDQAPGQGDRRVTGTTSAAYRGYVLAAFSIVAFFNFLDRAIFSVLAVSIKADLGLSDSEIGLLGGLAFALFYALLGLPLARYADRGNRSLLVATCLAVWSAATVACGLATGFWTLLLARIGVGAGEAGCFPPSYSILSDHYPPERRSFAIGMFHAGGNLGFLVGLMGAGILAELIGWRWTFAVLGGPGLVFALVLWLTVKEPRQDKAEGQLPAPAPTLPFGQAIRTIIGKSALVNLSIGYTLVIFGFYSAIAWLPHFFARTFAMSGAELGRWYGLAFGGGMIFGVVIGAAISRWLVKADRRWEVRIPGIVAVLAFPAFLAIPFVSDANAGLLLTFTGSSLVASGLGPGFAAVQSLVGSNLRATASAMVLLVSAILGQGLGPTLTGMLSDTLAAQGSADGLAQAMAASSFAFLIAAFFYRHSLKHFADEAELGRGA